MSRVHVAVGVIIDETGRVLIGKRHPASHQGGLWEFPGGKLESGEDVLTALRRELREELGIHVAVALPLLEICHDYADKQVLLDVWRVVEFTGAADSMEGQALRWVAASELLAFEFPAANAPIVKAVLDFSTGGM